MSFLEGLRPKALCKWLNSLLYSTSTMRTTGSCSSSIMNMKALWKFLSILFSY